MNEHVSRGKELLRILTNNGFEAYFIGEVVRNTILEKEINRVDITTSAHINVIKSIFKNCQIDDINDNSAILHYSDYEFVIQTFIDEEGIDDNTPSNKHYSKNLLADLANRDYTINAIAMSHSGKITDAHNGFNDLQKKRICHIGNGKLRFEKNPVSMLRAFSLVSELNYKIVKKTRSAIIKKYKALEGVPVTEYYDILKQIFEGPYSKKAILSLQSCKLHKSIPDLKKVINRLSDSYKKVTLEEALLMSYVLNGKMSDTYKECIEDYPTFVTIFALATADKKSKYDANTLYQNGLEISLEANRINYLLGRTGKKEKKIKKQWEKLPIHKIEDLDYKDLDLMRIINKSDFPKVEDILDNVASAVLSGTLNNNHTEIENYVLSLLPRYNIVFDLNGITDIEEFLRQEELKNKKPETKPNDETFSLDEDTEELNNVESNKPDENTEDNLATGSELTNHRLEILEKKFEEQQELIKEKEFRLQEMENQRLKNDIDLIIKQGIDYINNNDSLKNLILDQEEFKAQLQRFMYDYVKDQGDE